MTYYTALQTAKFLGVSTRTLQRWKRQGKFVPEFKTAGGHGRYSGKQIKLARMGVFTDKTTGLMG